MFASRKAEYTPQKSAARLHILQTFCSDKNTPHTLFVPGPDGAIRGDEDPTSQSVARYLFQGDSGRRMTNTIIDDENLEDMFLCLGSEKVEIYRPPTFVPGCSRLLAAWPNTTQMKPPNSMKGDSFSCEDFKIRAFLKTVKGRAKLGFTRGREEIERWPLVQAHALEEYGMGGFLTQKSEITDVSGHVKQALQYVDAHTVDSLLASNVEMMNFHWRTMMMTLDKPKVPWRRLELSELDLVEPLHSFYDFGTLSKRGEKEEEEEEKKSDKIRETFRGARVLLGTRTSLGGEGGGGISRNHATIGSTGTDGRPALHFTVEAEDAVTGIRCARTYLLTSIDNAVLPTINGDDEEEEGGEEGGEEKDEEKKMDDMDEEERVKFLNAQDRSFAATTLQLCGHLRRGLQRLSELSDVQR